LLDHETNESIWGFNEKVFFLLQMLMRGCLIMFVLIREGENKYRGKVGKIFVDKYSDGIKTQFLPV
jgi:hypothetical protein